jgi:hypothetical protein
MRDVGHVGKTGRNETQGFNFRGIDAVVNAVGPALREHGVVVVPNVKDYQYGTVEVGQRRSQMGHVRLLVEYTFIGPDNDRIVCCVAGESFDSGDKATAKAMSVAFRTALLQALCLPTDEPDPDSTSYERAPAPEHRPPDPLIDLKREVWAAQNRLGIDNKQSAELDFATRNPGSSLSVASEDLLLQYLADLNAEYAEKGSELPI